MSRLSIHHKTHYRYGQAVGFGPHRPRDSHADRLVQASLELYPAGETRWTYDAHGNCLCWYQPKGLSDCLSIVSHLVIDRFPAPLGMMTVVDPHSSTPVVYSAADQAVLAPFMSPVTAPDAAVHDWTRRHIGAPGEPALDFLTRLNRAIREEFRYAVRTEPGVLAPGDLVRQGFGSCRDLAWLMIESLRGLGYAARFTTGYLYSPESTYHGAGSTHAWCEVFLPSLGWMDFDPTNALVESPDLIRVATTRTPDEAAPISGHIFGEPLFQEMQVDVQVRAAAGPLLAVVA
jgi:transglutaminase-like putative cysteine protease